MAKTLKFDTFFYTKVESNLPVSISQMFEPDTTFILKLTDNTWVLYQETNREIVKASTLTKLLRKTFKISVAQFKSFARPIEKKEFRMLDDVFSTVDNFNLDKECYIIDPLTQD